MISGFVLIISGFVLIVTAFLMYYGLAYIWAAVFFGVIIAMIAAPFLYSYYLHKKGI